MCCLMKCTDAHAASRVQQPSRNLVVMTLQVCMAADEGLGALLPQQPPAMCLSLLKANLPGQGTVNSPTCQPTPLIHVSHNTTSPCSVQIVTIDCIVVCCIITWNSRHMVWGQKGNKENSNTKK